MSEQPYLRPMLAPLVGPVSPNADAMYAVLDSGYTAAQAACAQVLIDFDARVATGDALRNLARWGGVEILPNDADEDLRRRILAGPTTVPSSKAGIAQQVAALTGDVVSVQTIAPGQFTVTLFDNSTKAGQVMPLVRRLKASSMVPTGQMLVPKRATSRLGQVLLGTGKLGGASTMILLPDPTAPNILNIPVVPSPQIPRNAARKLLGHAYLGKATLGLTALGR